MWSLTSPRVERISGPKKFGSSAKKDFCNTIRQQRPLDKRSFRELGLGIDWSRQYPPCERGQTLTAADTN